MNYNLYNIKWDPKYIDIFKKQTEYLMCILDDEKLSISNYTGDRYINNNIHVKTKDAYNILNIFHNIPPLDHDLIVYKGIKQKVNLNLFQYSFISTTINKQVAIKFAQHDENNVYIFKIPSGSKIIPLALFSKYPNELEVLLPPNGKYVMEKTNTFIYTQGDNINTTYINPSICEFYTSSSIKIFTDEVSDILSSKLSFTLVYSHKMQKNIYCYDIPIKQGSIYKESDIPFNKILNTFTETNPSVTFVYIFTTNKNSMNVEISKGHIKIIRQ